MLGTTPPRAVALGLDRDEVEELAVPTYGLVDVDRLDRQMHTPGWPGRSRRGVRAISTMVGTLARRLIWLAGHVLRRHRFHALAAIQGWDARLRLMVDADFPPPTRALPQWICARGLCELGDGE